METTSLLENITKVKSAIEKGHLGAAFKIMGDCLEVMKNGKEGDESFKRLEDKYIQLSARFSRNKERDISDTLPDDQIDQKWNKVLVGLTAWVREFEEVSKGFLDPIKPKDETEQAYPNKFQRIVQYTITLDQDIENFSDEEQRKFNEAMIKLLRIDGIQINKIRPGSVKITYLLTEEQAEKLEKLLKEGALSEWDIIGFEQEESFLIDPKVLAVLHGRNVDYKIENDTLYLIRAKLSGADLIEADLFKANLIEADLSEADLSKANLIEAKLFRANLFGAKLVEADLSGANLFGAKLVEADLSGANLFGADLTKAMLFKAMLFEANLFEADLSGAKLFKAKLSGADLIEAKLTGADLSGAILNGTILSGADLSGAILTGADLSGAILNGTILSSADLIGAILTGADLSKANLEKSIFHIDQKEELEKMEVDISVINFVDNENRLVSEEVEIDV